MSYELHLGDCLEVMKTLPENSIDSIITDPPAGISFMNAQWDSDKGGRTKWVEWMTDVMTECLRVAKPGAMALVWSIPRTSHWTGLAMEQAGWEVRDVITHLFGSGFPKSHNISAAIDKATGAEREVLRARSYELANDGGYSGGLNTTKPRSQSCELTAPATDAARTWDGWGTSLKPAAEFWWLCMKPLDGTFANNALTHGVAGLAIDQCRIGTESTLRTCNGVGQSTSFDMAASGQHRVNGSDNGRWPANLILDESAAALLDEQSGPSVSRPVKPENIGKSGSGERLGQTNGIGYAMGSTVQTGYYEENANVSRFFKVIKDDKYCSLCDLPCNANFAVKSSSQTDLDSDFATDHVRPLTQPNNAGKSELLPLFANNAESTSMPTLETDQYSVQENAALTAIEQNVLNVKSAGSLCDSCATSIVAALVALQQAQSPESILGKAFMPEHTKQILTQCLATFVALLGSTDTILTIASLNLLFGCVRDAIRSSIPTNETANVSGQTSRLIYQSKASSSERNEGLQGMPEVMAMRYGERAQGPLPQQTPAKPVFQRNFHPTVKPLELMRWLCRLTKTPFGGTVLDPFMGSGSTGCAAVLEGRSFVGIEISEEYYSLAQKRLERAAAQPFLLEVT